MLSRSLVTIAVAALAAPAYGGVVITVQEPSGQSVMTLDGERMRVENGGDKEGDRKTAMIFDGRTHVLYQLDPEKKTFTRVDEAASQAMASRYRDALEKAKAKLTPEQRAQLEARMGKGGAGGAAPQKEHVYKFERAAGDETVAGYPCQHYRVLEDGKATQEGCFVPWSAGALKKEDLVAFREFAKWGEQMSASFTKGTGSARREEAGANRRVAAWLDSAPGFPAVLDRLDDSGQRTRESRIVKIERTSVPASQFAVPSGYTEEAFGGERRERKPSR
jgi:hypothetical protein